jgi:hypothetical protein
MAYIKVGHKQITDPKLWQVIPYTEPLYWVGMEGIKIEIQMYKTI